MQNPRALLVSCPRDARVSYLSLLQYERPWKWRDSYPRLSRHELYYIAPALIAHYVQIHAYQPPLEFIEAILALPSVAFRLGPLSLSVLQLADDPSEINREAFYQAFIKTRVGMCTPPELRAVPSGNYVTAGQKKMAIPATTLPDGTKMLCVLSDVHIHSQLETTSAFVELEAIDVLQIASRDGAGVIVQTSLLGRYGWARIAKKDVGALLASSRKHLGQK